MYYTPLIVLHYTFVNILPKLLNKTVPHSCFLNTLLQQMLEIFIVLTLTKHA